MDLSLYDKEVFQKYTSNSQRIRVLSETWFNRRMYCPACLNKKINKYVNNKKVSDFFCGRCKNDFELKSSSKNFGKKVNDGQYDTMINVIKLNKTPNFFFMHYSNQDWFIKNIFIVPKFFFSESIVEKRNPLKSSAERHDWVGCNILVKNIPEDGWIAIVKNEKMIDETMVNKKYKKLIFLNSKDSSSRGWTSDVLKCVRDIPKEEFILKDVYNFKDYLKEIHPENNNVEAKIRQQLQILRDNKLINFLSRGTYSVID